MRRYGVELSESYDQPHTYRYGLSISLCAYFIVLGLRFMIPQSFFSLFFLFDVSTVYPVWCNVDTKWKCIYMSFTQH